MPFELLWGSILATRTIDVVILAIVATIIIVVYVVKKRDLALLLYDREVALCSGIAVEQLTMLLMFVIAVAIGAAVHLTGALLVDSVTILPAIAARNLGRSLQHMVWWAVGIGIVGNLLGFGLTLVLNQPPGPLLVITVGLITLATFLRKRA